MTADSCSRSTLLRQTKYFYRVLPFSGNSAPCPRTRAPLPLSM